MAKSKSVSVKKVKVPTKQSRDMIGIRLDGADGAKFRRMAEAEGTGPSTLARIIIEQYIKDHAPTRTAKKKRKRP